jgi:hypothetical protein
VTDEFRFYYDFTCGDSYRVVQMVEAVRRSKPLQIKWGTLSLKEASRADEEPSILEGEEITGFSVLALAVDHALRAHDVDLFRRHLFDAIHRDHLELEREDLLGMAAKAGLDVDEFLVNQQRWLKEVAEEHREAERRWGVFGTPTLVFDDRDAVYLELNAVPESAQEALEMWNSISEVARKHRKLKEIRRAGT